MKAQYFNDLDALSRHQCKRELDEALRVRSMTPPEFSRWLTSALDPLQKLTDIALATEDTTFRPTARCFKTIEDKNHHDQQRELARAVRLALQRQADGCLADDTESLKP